MRKRSAGHPWPLARPRLLPMVTILGILATLSAAIYVPSRGGSGLVHGAERHLPPAPAFALPDLDGRTRTLAEFLGNKPILLEFMSPDCPHCGEMARILTRLHEVYGKRVQFLTVAFDRDARRVRTFVEREKHAWPYLMGSQETIEAYALEGVPTFFVVGPDGRIVASVLGSTSYETMSQAIETVLERR